MSTIFLVNHSTKISAEQVAQISKIIDSWIWYTVAPAHELVPWRVTDRASGNAYTIALFDNPDQAGALGYHWVDLNGRPYGRVFVNPILNSGGGVLTGENSICGTVGHEAAEMLCDEFANEWLDMPDGRQTAFEVGDAVQGDDYLYTLSVSKISGMVPNILLPAWSSSMVGPYDHRKLLTAPFSRRPGGYMLVRTAGEGTVSEWGQAMPQWKRDLKMLPGSRTSHRLATMPSLRYQVRETNLSVPEAPEPETA